MQARVVARSVVSYVQGRAGGRPAPSWCRRGQGAQRGWLGAVAFLLLTAFPGVVHAQDGGTVELIFELPPGFAPDNLPAIVDDSQQEQIVLGTDSLATTSSSLGLGEEISFTEPMAEMPAEPPPEATAEPPPEATAESIEESPAEQPSEESAAVEPAVQAAAKPASVTTFGVDATFASDVQIITLPATYRPTTATKLGIDVPFVRRTGDRGSVFELGDVSFSAGYRWGNPLKVLGITTLFVKAPTGDHNHRLAGGPAVGMGRRERVGVGVEVSGAGRGERSGVRTCRRGDFGPVVCWGAQTSPKAGGAGVGSGRISSVQPAAVTRGPRRPASGGLARRPPPTAARPRA